MLTLLLLLILPNCAALLLRLPPQLSHPLPTCSRVLQTALRSIEEPDDFPEALLGPWELRCTLSGAERIWVELGENGEVACSSSFGKGRSWIAEARPRGRWQLHVTLLDKLKRPFTLEGEVSEDDVHSLVVSGNMRGPPSRSSSRVGAQATESGVVVGEFNGYKLG